MTWHLPLFIRNRLNVTMPKLRQRRPSSKFRPLFYASEKRLLPNSTPINLYVEEASVESIGNRDTCSMQLTSPPSVWPTVSRVAGEHLLARLNREAVERLDVDGRLQYFAQHDDEFLLSTRRTPGVQHLALHPGSFLRVSYVDCQHSDCLRVFSGILVLKHESSCASSFELYGVCSGVAVSMHFMLFSPLIRKIEVLRRSIFTQNMRYLKDTPIGNLQYGANELRNEKPEVISRETADTPLAARIAAILPLRIPKGYRPEADYSAGERYFSEHLADDA